MNNETVCGIRVVCRFRPFNQREMSEVVANQDQFSIKYEGKDVVKIEMPEGQKTFRFDRIFPPDTTQVELFQDSARETVNDVINGFNGTFFAYGQTGAGKSFSMFGPDIGAEDLQGVIPRASRHIFNHIANDKSETEYIAKCSFLEIYNEQIRDLFNPAQSNLQVRESPTRGIYVGDATELCVRSEDEVSELLKLGEASRAVSFTQMNAKSSRSHSVFIIMIEQKSPEGTTKTGKLNLVDLAGSEKVKKTGATGQTLNEAKKINQSLSALGMCIHALVEGIPHVPFRDSKLTRLLQESLGGNCKTTLLVCASAHPFNAEETISTLMFAQRAKSLKNTVKCNAQLSVAELNRKVEAAQREIARLISGNKALKWRLEWMKMNSSLWTGSTLPPEILEQFKQMMEQEQMEESQSNSGSSSASSSSSSSSSSSASSSSSSSSSSSASSSKSNSAYDDKNEVFAHSAAMGQVAMAARRVQNETGQLRDELTSLMTEAMRQQDELAVLDKRREWMERKREEEERGLEGAVQGVVKMEQEEREREKNIAVLTQLFEEGEKKKAEAKLQVLNRIEAEANEREKKRSESSQSKTSELSDDEDNDDEIDESEDEDDDLIDDLELFMESGTSSSPSTASPSSPDNPQDVSSTSNSQSLDGRCFCKALVTFLDGQSSSLDTTAAEENTLDGEIDELQTMLIDEEKRKAKAVKQQRRVKRGEKLISRKRMLAAQEEEEFVKWTQNFYCSVEGIRQQSEMKTEKNDGVKDDTQKGTRDNSDHLTVDDSLQSAQIDYLLQRAQQMEQEVQNVGAQLDEQKEAATQTMEKASTEEAAAMFEELQKEIEHEWKGKHGADEVSERVAQLQSVRDEAIAALQEEADTRTAERRALNSELKATTQQMVLCESGEKIISALKEQIMALEFGSGIERMKENVLENENPQNKEQLQKYNSLLSSFLEEEMRTAQKKSAEIQTALRQTVEGREEEREGVISDGKSSEMTDERQLLSEMEGIEVVDDLLDGNKKDEKDDSIEEETEDGEEQEEMDEEEMEEEEEDGDEEEEAEEEEEEEGSDLTPNLFIPSDSSPNSLASLLVLHSQYITLKQKLAAQRKAAQEAAAQEQKSEDENGKIKEEMEAMKKRKEEANAEKKKIQNLLEDATKEPSKQKSDYAALIDQQKKKLAELTKARDKALRQLEVQNEKQELILEQKAREMIVLPRTKIIAAVHGSSIFRGEAGQSAHSVPST
ncbi:kinesin 1C [Monocercomonoides exilis]|uniref:kinesin 1C n=1 Tax=Monocercomonoides exilis TaxID=2049356 RepID=UPI00355A4585|nr:kinesin 1C [Monocercomonoides exilis]|eukprot:MONOS_844.1-p1 / transcript=MONOS_844.1 / gene=MONOS_844 / organism=Monocercomonoides_exilis_PA203 / gene_product=kinesin 1C / transcript_product=kinesin 1C / location=Mono_scaffold00014:55871-60438(+) / protein_length=1227 / sequence_SO=supercontig / SO=protein_coding / is_pseudo=false